MTIKNSAAPPIDLHTHTTASDGSLTPAEVVTWARRLGLKAIAITDHDTLDGIAEAEAAGSRLQVEVIPGAELSANSQGSSDLHILGYFLRREERQLKERIVHLQDLRAQRNQDMAARFQEQGIPITLEQLQKMAGGKVIGRPHFARLLVKRGICKSEDEAFKRFLKPGAPTYVEKVRFEPREAIEIIRDNGGLAVMAHPFTLIAPDAPPLAEVIKELVGYGLQGIEVYYGPQSLAGEQELLNYAAQYGLLITGGTDFHGEGRPPLEAGEARNPALCYTLVEEMKRYLTRQGRKDLR